MKRDACQLLFMYGFAGAFLVLLAVMLCITPNPGWMDQGDESPVGFANPINASHEIYSGAVLHRVQGKQLHFVSANQMHAMLKARDRHGAFYQQGDKAFNTGA